jgi:hypothetical protein
MFTVLNNGTWTEKRLNSRSHGEGRIEGPVIACLILEAYAKPTILSIS